MTLWLAIDTSVGTSVAILRDGVLVASADSADPMGHAENIGTCIFQALENARVKPSELSAIVVGRGPAPFTGLRVGLASAIAFAEGANKPLFGVVSHDAVALAEFEAGTQGPLLVHTDARRKEIYWSLYSGLDRHGVPVRIDGPHVSTREQMVALLAELNIHASESQAQLSAQYIAKVALAQTAAGESSQDVSAIYLREPDAALPKPNSRVGKQVSS